MQKSNIAIMVLIALVFAGAGFFGGIKYNQAKAKTSANPRLNMQAFNGGNFAGRTGGATRLGGGQNGGFAGGEIISKDDQSITVKMPNDGGSKIVFYSTSTSINKTATGTPADLSVGTNVVVNGTPNQDGSLTAKNITIGGGLMFQRIAPAN
jgi:hypothetical protein